MARMIGPYSPASNNNRRPPRARLIPDLAVLEPPALFHKLALALQFDIGEPRGGLHYGETNPGLPGRRDGPGAGFADYGRAMLQTAFRAYIPELVKRTGKDGADE